MNDSIFFFLFWWACFSQVVFQSFVLVSIIHCRGFLQVYGEPWPLIFKILFTKKLLGNPLFAMWSLLQSDWVSCFLGKLWLLVSLNLWDPTWGKQALCVCVGREVVLSFSLYLFTIFPPFTAYPCTQQYTLSPPSRDPLFNPPQRINFSWGGGGTVSWLCSVG